MRQTSSEALTAFADWNCAECCEADVAKRAPMLGQVAAAPIGTARASAASPDSSDRSVARDPATPYHATSNTHAAPPAAAHSTSVTRARWLTSCRKIRSNVAL